jgi:hypothetical protein
MLKSVTLPIRARFEDPFLLFASIALLLLTGCGPVVNGKRNPYAYETTLPSTSQSTTTNRSPSNSTITPTTTQSPTPNPTGTYYETPGGTRGVPVIQYKVSGIGYQAVTISIRTGRMLRVKFKPDQQTRYIAGTNTKPVYSRLAVYLTMNDQTQPTEMLSNGLQGAAEESRLIDLSYAMKPTCPASNSACRETFTFKVERPNYDYYCYNSGQGCPWTRVADKHPWSGTLYIQTSDTEAL